MKNALVLVVGLALSAGPVLANDYFSPPWRGEQNTVIAEWDTWTGFNTTPAPFYPDSWASIPTLLASPDAQAYDTAQYYAAYDGHNDVVELNGIGQIDFLMPNFSGELFTEIWIQLTYKVDQPTDLSFLIDTSPYTDDINGPQLEGAVTHADGWVTQAYSFTILPSVDSEMIALDFANSGSVPVYVDDVIVESVAAPEPTMLGLLSAAVFAVIRRR